MTAAANWSELSQNNPSGQRSFLVLTGGVLSLFFELHIFEVRFLERFAVEPLVSTILPMSIVPAPRSPCSSSIVFSWIEQPEVIITVIATNNAPVNVVSSKHPSFQARIGKLRLP